MRSRRRLVVALVTLFVALAGCTEDPDREYPAPSDDPEPDEPEETGIAELVGHPAGIAVLPLDDPSAPPMLNGVVYDIETGAPIAEASVFATCVRGSGAPTYSQVAASNEDGFFVFSDPAALSDCLQVTYEVQAPFFTLAVPLGSVGPQSGTQTFVYGGLFPAAGFALPGDATP